MSVQAILSPRIATAFLRYRVLAWTTGIWLLGLTVVVLVQLFGFDPPSFVAIVHGWIYLIYLVVTLDLAVKARWTWWKAVGILLAGTVPFLSFVVERRVSARMRAQGHL